MKPGKCSRHSDQDTSCRSETSWFDLRERKEFSLSSKVPRLAPWFPQVLNQWVLEGPSGRKFEES